MLVLTIIDRESMLAPETIRIISARRATKAERNTYAKRLQP
jgi:uncharacterized DUF497 family protein